MKKKNFIKKLEIKKSTISHLNHQMMNRIAGGTIGFIPPSADEECQHTTTGPTAISCKETCHHTCDLETQDLNACNVTQNDC